MLLDILLSGPKEGSDASSIVDDIRRRVIVARQSGETTVEVSDRFSVSRTFVRKVM
jgi:hypothetical protein